MKTTCISSHNCGSLFAAALILTVLFALTTCAWSLFASLPIAYLVVIITLIIALKEHAANPGKKKYRPLFILLIGAFVLLTILLTYLLLNI